jgi:hypothetical protein
MCGTDDSRPFPIQGGYDKKPDGGAVVQVHRYGSCSIPWWLAEIAYEYYSERFGTSQTLERLAERGGFGRQELLMLLRRDPV